MLGGVVALPPVPYAEHLDALQQKQLLVGAPVLGDDGEAHVPDHAVGVVLAVGRELGPGREALGAELDVAADGALDAHDVGDFL